MKRILHLIKRFFSFWFPAPLTQQEIDRLVEADRIRHRAAIARGRAWLIDFPTSNDDPLRVANDCAAALAFALRAYDNGARVRVLYD